MKLNEICRQGLRNRFNNDRENNYLLLDDDDVEFNNDESNTDVIFSFWCSRMWNKISFIRYIVNFKFLNGICYRDVINFFIK